MKATEKQLSVPTVIGEVARSFDSSVLWGWHKSLQEMMAGSKGTYYVTMGILWLLVYASTIMALDAITVGYHHAYGVTREIPWGILIAAYVFFVVTSTGLCIVSAIGHIFAIKSFLPISQRAAFLSIVTVCCGFMVILLDIEMPFRMMLYNVLSPNFTSNIWWMGTLYGVFLFFMLFEFSFLLMGWYRLAMYVGMVALISDIAANSNLGAVFGMLHGREFWYGPYIPIYFILTAIMSGCAVVILFTWIAYKMENKEMEQQMRDSIRAVSKLCALMIAIVAFFTAWNIITGLVGSAGKQEIVHAVLSGRFAVNFWLFEIAFALVIPFVLILIAKGEKLGMLAFASAMMLVGVFVMRMDMVVLGQVVGVFYELGVNEYSGLLTYTPSWHEIAIVGGAMGVAAITFLAGEKVFKGHTYKEHH